MAFVLPDVFLKSLMVQFHFEIDGDEWLILNSLLLFSVCPFFQVRIAIKKYKFSHEPICPELDFFSSFETSLNVEETHLFHLIPTAPQNGWYCGRA